MLPEIMWKLEARLSKPPVSEEEVVYSMVQIRKVLEHCDEKARYDTLNMFCDWALHARLYKAGARRFLEKVDQQWGKLSLNGPSLLDMLSFDLLRAEFRGFCKAKGLPTLWSSDDAAWGEFLALYSGVIVEIPLELKKEDFGFKNLAGLVIRPSPTPQDLKDNNPGKRFISFVWEFTFTTETTTRVPYNLIY